MACAKESLYKRWDALYRKGWNNDTMGVNVHRMSMQFDGGVEHKDGSRWALAPVIPGFTILKIQVATAGLQATGGAPVTIDLGCVSFERDCNCDPLCIDFEKILNDYDVSSAKCGDVPCGPWDCGDSCMPDCCPSQMPATCCPPDNTKKACGLSDLVMTLNGTPAACSKLDMIVWYVMS